MAAGYATAMMWLGICVSGCEVVRRRERMRRSLSQLLTNERSKVAIEIALLSRRLQERSFSPSFATEVDFALTLAMSSHYNNLGRTNPASWNSSASERFLPHDEK